MIQRAEWRRLSGDPRSPLGWWLRELRATLGVVLGLTVATLLFLPLALGLGFLPAGILIALLAASFATHLALKRAKQSSRLAALGPSPAPAECFPVEFSIGFREVCTGLDQGIASFVDGWMHVEGLHTSFSVRPVDITRVKPLPDRDSFDLPGGQRIDLRSIGRTQEDRDTFRETLRVWYRFPFGQPRGEPLLPPLAVHPSAVSRPLNALFAYTLLAIIAFTAFGTLKDWRGIAPYFAFVIVGTVYASRGAAKAIRELRQMKDIHREALMTGEIDAIIAERALERL